MNPTQIRPKLFGHFSVLGSSALLLVAIALSLSPGQAAPAGTIMVDSTADVVADDGQCTLREAITAANTDTSSGASGGECPAGSGADTITLPAGTYTLSITGKGENNNVTGDLDVTSEITINGSGESSTIIQAGTTDSNGIDRAFHVVNSSSDLTLDSVTVRHGRLTSLTDPGGGIYNGFGKLILNKCTITGNNSGDEGGGVYSHYGMLTIGNSTISANSTSGSGGGVTTAHSTGSINNSTISNNSGDYCGGLDIESGTMILNKSTISDNSTDYGEGGGVCHYWGTLTIVDSVISGNSSDYEGGGVYNYKGTLNINNGTITDNSGNDDGGGLYLYQYDSSSTVTIEDSTISGNSADGDGGGMYNDEGTVTVDNTTLSDNTAAHNGGAVYNYHQYQGSMTIQNSTLSGNSAAIDGGGIYNNASNLSIENSIISGNTVNAGSGGGVYNDIGALTFENSAVRDNETGTGADCTGCSVSGNGGNGGGVNNDYGPLTFKNSTVSGNRAGDGGDCIACDRAGAGGSGGGVYNHNGPLTFKNSTVSGNRAGDGGDCNNHDSLTGCIGGDGGSGGGVYNRGTQTMTIENSTVSGNSTGLRGSYCCKVGQDGKSGDGGGVCKNDGKVEIAYSTITRNDAHGSGGGIFAHRAAVSYMSTILSRNSASKYKDCIADSGGTFISGGYNAVGSSCPPARDFVTNDPKLDPLADNYGDTQTHALQLGSIVWNAIPAGHNNCGNNMYRDQRGVLRPSDNYCEIGAYEEGGVFWVGHGPDNNWGSRYNWSGEETPWISDAVVFNSGSSKDATMDGLAPLYIHGLVITSGYRGTLTQGDTILNLTDSFGQSGGTFAGGSGQMKVGGSFYQSGGTFNAPDDLRVDGGWERSGGTFSHHYKTVTFDGSGTHTHSGNTTFYIVKVNSGTLVDLAHLFVRGELSNYGVLQKTLDVNGSSDVKFFHTGNYGGLTLNANGSDLGSTTVKIRGKQDCTSSAGETVQRCFDINPANPTGRNATITFYFSLSDLSGNDCNSLIAYHWNENNHSWEALKTGKRSCESEPASIQSINVSDFSLFVLKSGDPPSLPYNIHYYPLIFR